MSRLTMILGLILISMPTQADLNQSTSAMCQKFKTCSIAELEKQNLSADSIATLVESFDSMCQSWVKPYSQTLGQAGLESKAVACIDSMVARSCDDLMGAQGKFSSPACDQFQKAAENAGIDWSK